MPQLHSRELVTNKAESEVREAFHKICEQCVALFQDEGVLSMAREHLQ